MVKQQQLDEIAAKGQAHDVGAVHVQGVEDGDRIVGEVGCVVGMRVEGPHVGRPVSRWS
ncbi:hypothetical protein GCM10012275_09720 [Longimycelium tulufanense]|uniref:Uncharacterized protein n=1 Tax=Longimycelium tulufanense TaxID=907463 RepID=A0A8J3FSZ1_9PSEU|nr:hypothetical protein GCM10012275_09720 [Longimycelium tulufanense]